MDLTRRHVLTGAGAIGLSATLAGGRLESAHASGTAPADPDYVLLTLFNNSGFNGQISFCLGGASCQTAEIGEVMYAVNRINAKTGNPGNPSTDPPAMGPTAKDFEILVGLSSNPVMLTRNQGDIFFNGGSGEPPTPTTGKYDQPAYAFGLLDNVPDRKKKFVDFTLRQGATLHDQPLAPQFATEVMFDWLDPFMK